MAYPNRWDGRTGPEMIVWHSHSTLSLNSAMAFPLFHTANMDQDPTLVDVTQQFEQIPRNAAGQPLGTARGIVHFDLDPLNGRSACNLCDYT